MNPKTSVTDMATLLVAGNSIPVRTQSLSQTTLVIGLQNVVDYMDDIADPLQFAKNSNPTPAGGVIDFGVATPLGDIVTVNGQPAKGLYASRARGIRTSLTLQPGNAIADVTRTAMRELYFEILTSSGTPVGTIFGLGLSGGSPPPGAPSGGHGNWAIVGGTGAFLGAIGQICGTGAAGRAASMAEDPSRRRINGGTSFSFNIYVIPMFQPQIATISSGPAVMHADHTPVSSHKPAAPGETLSLLATGLGPTVPEVDLGLPFPSSPAANVNSPVTVTVNGEAAQVLNAVGYPGSVGAYQVDFQVPSNAAKGTAALQLTAAWIPATPVTITVH
ncbi:MAG TPA: hypothetical protein VIY49_30235 [Bryobacteraceae bacterium]